MGIQYVTVRVDTTGLYQPVSAAVGVVGIIGSAPSAGAGQSDIVHPRLDRRRWRALCPGRTGNTGRHGGALCTARPDWNGDCQYRLATAQGQQRQRHRPVSARRHFGGGVLAAIGRHGNAHTPPRQRGDLPDRRRECADRPRRFLHCRADGCRAGGFLGGAARFRGNRWPTC